MPTTTLSTSTPYFTVNKNHIKNLGSDAAIVLSDLTSKRDYFGTRNELTEDGYFFNSSKRLVEDTGLSKWAIRQAIKRLKDEGCIHTKVLNSPPTVHFFLISSRISELASTVRDPQIDCAKASQSIKRLPPTNKNTPITLQLSKPREAQKTPPSEEEDTGVRLSTQARADLDLVERLLSVPSYLDPRDLAYVQEQHVKLLLWQNTFVDHKRKKLLSLWDGLPLSAKGESRTVAQAYVYEAEQALMNYLLSGGNMLTRNLSASALENACRKAVGGRAYALAIAGTPMTRWLLNLGLQSKEDYEREKILNKSVDKLSVTCNTVGQVIPSGTPSPKDDSYFDNDLFDDGTDFRESS